MFRRYRDLHGCTEADLGRVAVAQRAAAVLNPGAIMRKPMSLDDYLAEPYGEAGTRQVEECRFVHYSADVAGKACSIVYGQKRMVASPTSRPPPGPGHEMPVEVTCFRRRPWGCPSR